MNKPKQHVYVLIKHSADGEDDRIVGVYSSKTLAMRVRDKLTYYNGFARQLYSLLKFPVQGVEVLRRVKGTYLSIIKTNQ